MKLILFLIVVIAIYFIVIHINNKKNSKQQQEPKKRDKLQTHKKCSRKNNALEGFSPMIDDVDDDDDDMIMDDLLAMVRSEHMNQRYLFNAADQPVTSRYPDKSPTDTIYVRNIENNISRWEDVIVRDIQPIFIMETSTDFLIKGKSVV